MAEEGFVRTQAFSSRDAVELVYIKSLISAMFGSVYHFTDSAFQQFSARGKIQ